MKRRKQLCLQKVGVAADFSLIKVVSKFDFVHFFWQKVKDLGFPKWLAERIHQCIEIDLLPINTCTSWKESLQYQKEFTIIITGFTCRGNSSFFINNIPVNICSAYHCHVQ